MLSAVGTPEREVIQKTDAADKSKCGSSSNLQDPLKLQAHILRLGFKTVHWAERTPREIPEGVPGGLQLQREIAGVAADRNGEGWDWKQSHY